MDIVAIGELLIDFTPEGENASGMALFSRNPGGAPANVLAQCAMLNMDTAFIGMVGKDGFGDFLKSYLERLNISTKGLKATGKAATTLAFVQLDDKADRSFTFYRNPGADQLLCFEDIDQALINECKIFHFGSLSLTHSPSRESVLRAVTIARQTGKIISYDPNFRPLLWDNKDTARKWMLEGAKLADIIKVSHEEIALLTGSLDCETGAKCLMDFGASLVLVSLGENGAFFYNRTASGLVPAYDVLTIDTTGAGDSFFGAALYKLLGKNLDEIANLGESELTQIIEFANSAGAMSTTKTSAINSMPDLLQIQNCMRSQKTLIK